MQDMCYELALRELGGTDDAAKELLKDAETAAQRGEDEGDEEQAAEAET